jgi:O-acetylhomoserine (thiol)-lyase
VEVGVDDNPAFPAVPPTTMSDSVPRRHRPLTRLLHADRLGGVEHGAVHKPLHVAAAFNYPTARDLVEVFQGNQAGHVYARQGNPTVNALEAKVTLLEDAKGTATFATGMAAITAVVLALLRAGDHIVCTRFLFGNTNSLMQTLQGLGVDVTFVDATEAANVRAAITPATRLVFVETIANPVTQVADLDGIGRVCKDAGVLYVVDGTLTTPLLVQGRAIGAGLVVHSLSKSIGGHGNALGGAVVDTGCFDWSTFANILPPYKKGPADKWGLLQVKKKGLRDMGGTLRADGDAVAQWLEAQPAIARVHYPGLASHAQHERAARLFTGGFGMLMSFELRDGIDTLAFLDALQLVIVSSHLADNRTLAIPVAQTIYYEMGAERRADMGIAEGLIRLSVGIEDIEDLKADFAQALARFAG